MEWLIISVLCLTNWITAVNLGDLENRVNFVEMQTQEQFAVIQTDIDDGLNWTYQLDDEVGFLQTAYDDFESRVQVLGKVNKGKILKLGARL